MASSSGDGGGGKRRRQGSSCADDDGDTSGRDKRRGASLSPRSEGTDGDDDDDNSDAMYEYDDSDADADAETSHDGGRTRRYVVLTEDDLRARQEADTARVAEVLSVPAGLAAALLRHFRWRVGRAQEEWFSDGRRVRGAIGLAPDDGGTSLGGVATARSAAPRVCGVCFDAHPSGRTRAAACAAHFYCDGCWRGYVRAAVGDGACCVALRCPDPACAAPVVRELVDEVLAAAGSEEDCRDRYAHFCLRSYVEEGGGGIKWCPAPGCARAVEVLDGDGAAPADVFCACGHGFCWLCNEEAHWPVPCSTVRAWLAKNSSDAETANWVLANTKHCPKCRRPIEKNQSCNHMTCRAPCLHQFCLRCAEEAHRPVPCGKVRAKNSSDAETANWLLAKNSSDAETANWLLANTKHCPECRRPIEKNQGCNHMTCREPCRHQFCWLCLDPWNDHRGCSRFDSRLLRQQQQQQQQQAEEAEEEEEVAARRRQAKASLDRYLYHYERWAANGKSLHKALADMDQLERSELERMAWAVDLPATDLGFVTEAYRQVADGRRVLRWVHAYGYFLDPERDATKRVLFEDLQSQANRWLERLHDCAELERKDLFSTANASNGESAVAAEMFRAYREKVANLTVVTRKFLRNLVEAFETDLPEVATPPFAVQTVNGPTMGHQTVRPGGIVSTTTVSNVASQGLSTLQASSSSLISQEANIAINGVQEHIPIMDPVFRPGGHSSILSHLSQVQLMNSAFFGGSTSMELPDAGETPIQIHMSNMISSGVTSTPSTSGPVQPISNQQIVQSTALGFSGSNTCTESGNSNLDGSSSHLNIMVLGRSVKPVPQGLMTDLQLGQGAIGANQNVISGLQPTTLSSAPAKYAKIWEGYSNATTPETLAVEWPESMHIARLISQEHMNNKQYVGHADFLVFRTLNQHGFFQQLQEKKLCAVITLPSQTLLLSMSEKQSRMIGMLFPQCAVIVLPSQTLLLSMSDKANRHGVVQTTGVVNSGANNANAAAAAATTSPTATATAAAIHADTATGPPSAAAAAPADAAAAAAADATQATTPTTNAERISNGYIVANAASAFIRLRVQWSGGQHAYTMGACSYTCTAK
ncbi:hypothetical protein U9M48_001276 [Paspalum notatum var. saurae]|uniref:RBR-type E3 ubiquitin transferase n=1 Tax=Paspalum notatum var. saurae TaxID=547442 RepID=A0AAQ3PHX0_PASNO